MNLINIEIGKRYRFKVHGFIYENEYIIGSYGSLTVSIVFNNDTTAEPWVNDIFECTVKSIYTSDNIIKLYGDGVIYV